MQNAYIESFNGRFRDERLNLHWFTTIAEARRIIEAWRVDCNEQRPYSSLAYRTPAECAALRSLDGFAPRALAPQPLVTATS